MYHRILAGSVAAASLACGRSDAPSPTCGIMLMTGPLAAMEAFAQGNALAAAPDSLPPVLPIRVVAGTAVRGIATRSGAGWQVSPEDSLPAAARPGYGVLVVDGADIPRGVLLYDGTAIPGARSIGTVAIRDSSIPLLGVRINPSDMSTPACPIFPDSLR